MHCVRCADGEFKIVLYGAYEMSQSILTHKKGNHVTKELKGGKMVIDLHYRPRHRSVYPNFTRARKGWSDVKISVSFSRRFHTGLAMTDKIAAFCVSFFVGGV